MDLWRAKAGAIGSAAGCQRVRSGLSSITELGADLRSRIAHGGEGAQELTELNPNLNPNPNLRGWRWKWAQRGRARPCVRSAWEGTERARREEVGMGEDG